VNLVHLHDGRLVGVATQQNTLAWKALTTTAGLAAALVTKKLLGAAWKQVTGLAPPDPPEHPDNALPHALAWSVLAGAAAAVAKVCLTRQAAMCWRGRTGELPPGLALNSRS
jgi:malic enzyme